MATNGNGPRTHELVGEVSALRELVRERGSEIQKRLTELETKMNTIMYIGGLIGTIFATVIALLIIGILR